MQEIWKDIVGYEGLYKVSNKGRIKSMPKTWRCGHNSIRSKEESFLKICTSTDYSSVRLHNGASKFHSIHRLLAEHFISNPENKKEVNHINGDKHDNRLENLEWVTSSENRNHAFRIGLKKSASGAIHYASKAIMVIDFDENKVLSVPCLAMAAKITDLGESKLRHLIKGRVSGKRYKIEYV